MAEIPLDQWQGNGIDDRREHGREEEKQKGFGQELMDQPAARGAEHFAHAGLWQALEDVSRGQIDIVHASNQQDKQGYP